jgi:multiple sugar transport system substrate-binding protein
MRVLGRVVARCATVCLVLAAAACGTDTDTDGTVVDWYVAPGRTDEQGLADTCAADAGGRYAVRLHELPTDVDDRHTELVRRLSGANGSIDLLSADSHLVPELAAAGFLAPLSSAQQQRWGEGVAPGALDAATVDGELAAAPWWFDPELLWFRGVTAERAGLDVTAPITWDDLIAGAARLGVSVQIEDVDGTGLSQWVAALVAAAGGSLVDGDDDVTLDTAPAREAASIVDFYRQSGVGPGPVADATDRFVGQGGGFLLAPSSASSAAPMQAVAPELQVTGYPVVSEAAPAPAAGVSLAVARDSDAQRAAADLIDCLTGTDQQRTLLLETGHAPARPAIYDDEAVQDQVPDAAAVQEALRTARPVPVTPSWTAIRRAIDATWRPLESVSPASTPAAAQAEAAAAVAGELP